MDGCERDHGLCICLALKPGQSQSLTSPTDSNVSYTKMFGQNRLNGCRRKGGKSPWPVQTHTGERWS